MAKRDEKLASECRKNYEAWRGYFKRNIDNYHFFTEFVMGQMWTDDEVQLLATYKKQALVFNKLAPLANSLLGEQQQNTPQLEVVPSSSCSEQVANIRAVLVKDIALGSDAKRVYQNAAKQAIIGGFGAYSFSTRYANDRSFDQEITMHSVKDPTRCFWDASAADDSKIDGMFAGTSERMSRKKVRALYGKKVDEQTENMPSEYENLNFADDDAITVFDYYKREYYKETLIQLSTGDTLTQKEFDELEMELIEDEELGNYYIYNGMPVRIEDSRSLDRFKVKHYRIIGDYIVDDGEFPSDLLPVVFVDQNSYYDKSGKQVCKSFFQDALDSQRYLNYLGTQSAYMLKVSRWDQFIMPRGNARAPDTQQIWRDPGSINGALFYDEVDSGQIPQQLRPPELSQSLLTQYERAMNDIYTSTGLYAARLGQQGQEVSGAAVDARTRQGSYTTYPVFTSINRAIAAGGMIINEMIPRVYDTERVLKLMMPDEGLQEIVINRQMDEYGQMVENDITKGSFQVKLMPGASFEGQKQQAMESLQMVMQANPQLFNIIADLYADNLPLSNNIEIKNRLKTLVPPEIIQAGKTGKPIEQKEQQPDPQQIAQEQQQQLQAQELQLKKAELQLKYAKMQHDMEMEMAELENERVQMGVDVETQTMRYEAEMNKTRTDREIAHSKNLVDILTHLK
jgi:hypothetical protein